MSRNNIKEEKTIICTGCPKGCRIKVTADADNSILEIKNYSCPVGKKYARKEYENPTRILPTTVKVKNGELPLVSVKTKKPISKKILRECMKEIAQIEVEAPVKIGDVIKKDINNTGVKLIATRNIKFKE